MILQLLKRRHKLYLFKPTLERRFDTQAQVHDAQGLFATLLLNFLHAQAVQGHFHKLA
ncbi:hypothetical protein HRbin36_02843 [bacterium HR36]|nr:hypothetical protein HRbin36_02843 [bacterium HR36]